MKKKYILYILLFLAYLWLGMHVLFAQYVATAFTPSAATGTNISFVGSATNMVTSGNTSVAVTYTCASTSNRMIMIGDASGTGPLSITDTGGQASGATVLGTGTWSGGENYGAWDVGCAASSNTTTLHIASGTASLIFQMAEYSGIGTSGDGLAVNVGSSTTCSVSATASSTGDLSVGYVGVGTAITNMASNSPFSNRMVASTNIVPNAQFGWTFDALHQASGSLTFAPTFPSTASTSRCLIVNIPGTAGTSPGFFPTLAQANGGCTGSSPATLAMPASVTSGDTLVFGFKNENNVAPSSISDTLGTTYTLQVHEVGSSNNLWIYTGPATSSGANTLTLSGASFSFVCVGWAEYRGLAGTTTNTAGQTTSAATMTWSQTVSNNNSIVFACVGAFHSGSTFSAFGGSGFSYVTSGGNSDAMACTWARVITAATQNPSITVSTSDSNVGASIVMQ